MRFKRILPAALALAAAALGAACDDSTGFEAQLETEADTFVAFALTGTAPQLPTAYNSTARPRGFVTRIDALQFDVAFDLTPAGQIALLPVNVVGLPVDGRRVGIWTDTTSFERMQRAPSRDYVYDSVVVVPVGQTVVIQAPSGSCGFYALSQFVFTKFVVDSVSQASRRIWFHAVHNPNCGYRSFRPGIPED